MAARNAILSFGLVNIPVGVDSMVETQARKTMKTLHAPCSTPVTQVKTCPVCNVPADETISGFEVSKGEFLLLTEEEIAETKAESSSVIVLTKFSPNDTFPAHTDTSRWLLPRAGFEHPYWLFMQAMTQERVFGIATASLWGKEHPCVVEVYPDGLVLTEVSPASTWRDPALVPETTNAAEVKMAAQFIQGMSGPWLTEDFQSSQQTAFDNLIAAKLAGKTWLAPDLVPEPAPTADIMAVLRASIKQQKTKVTTKGAA